MAIAATERTLRIFVRIHPVVEVRAALTLIALRNAEYF